MPMTGPGRGGGRNRAHEGFQFGVSDAPPTQQSRGGVLRFNQGYASLVLIARHPARNPGGTWSMWRYAVGLGEY